MDTTAASGRGVGRRALLAAGAAGGLGAALTASSPAVSARSTAAALDPADWESVRAQFTLDPGLSHFAAYVLASHPAPVREAIARHRDGLDVDTEGYLSAGRFEDRARAAAARYLGAEPREVALTDSTTMGMGLLLGGIAIRADQEALSTTHDFIGTGAALRLLADRTGASVRKVRLYERPSLADADEMVERLRVAIRPSTRLLVVTWVHSGTGVRVPVQRIGALVARVNENRSGRDRLLLVVDGVHGLGVVDQQVADLGCDFFTAGTHKWRSGRAGPACCGGARGARSSRRSRPSPVGSSPASSTPRVASTPSSTGGR